jgi:hypothetical protein
MLEVGSTPEPYYDQKNYVNKYTNDTIGNQTRDLSVWGAMLPFIAAVSS